MDGIQPILISTVNANGSFDYIFSQQEQFL